MTLLPLAPAGSSTVQADRVQIVDGDGAQITSFGGGTQYADGASAATPTGTQANWNESGTQRAVSLTKALPVQPGTGATFPVSASSLPLPALAATSTKQSDGSQKTQIVDGSGNVIGATSNALDVNIKSGASSGTEYTEDAAAAANPAGPMTMAVRADSLAGVTTTDGDNIAARATDKGELYVKHADSIAVTSATFATSAKQDTGNTSLATLAGAVSGTEVQVDVLTMPTVQVQSNSANLATQTTAAAIQTSVELIDDTVATLGTTTYTEAATKGLIMGAVRRDADTTLANTTNEVAPLQVDANGYLKVEVFDGGGSHTVDNNGTFAVQVDGSALTALQLIDDIVYTDDTSTHSTGSSKGALIMAAATPTDTAVNANDIGAVGMTNNREMYVSLRDIAGATAVTGSGTATGALRVELPTNGTGTLATISTVSALGTGTTGPQKAEDVASAGGDMGVAIMAARLDTPVANAGVSNDGDYTTPILDNFRKLWVTGTEKEDTAHVPGEAIVLNGVRRIDTAATSAGTSGDWATMDASAEGAVWSTLTPTTTSGCSIFRSIDLDESEEEIKASAGNIYGYYFYNAAASIRYLKFYNATAANTTVGTTTPVLTIPVPATTPGHVTFPYPISFSTAISAAVTTGLADNDTGAPGANDFIINVYYK